MTDTVESSSYVYEKVLAHLQAHPEGTSSKELMDVFQITKSAVYTTIYHLRKRFEPIVIKHFKYFYKFRKNAIVPTQSTKTVQSSSMNSLLDQIPKINHASIINSLKELDPDEVEDCLKNLRNSIFYAFSAEAVVKSKRIINQIRKDVIQG